MYILNIKALKNDISQAKVTDRYILPYVIGNSVLISLAIALNIEFNAWDHVSNVLIILITGPAVYYLFKSNSNNPEGSFLPNLVLMSWVCTFRFYIFFVIPLYVILMIAGVSIGEGENILEDSNMGDSMASVLIEILLVIYIAKHIKTIGDSTA